MKGLLQSLTRPGRLGLLLFSSLGGCGHSGETPTAGAGTTPGADGSIGGSAAIGGGGAVAVDGGAGATNGGANAGGAGAANGGSMSSGGSTTSSGGSTTSSGGSTTSSGGSTNTGGAGGGGPTVGQYDPFELTLSYPTGSLSNPWEQVSVTATVTSPSGKTLTFDGFYYDVDTYKVRFAPAELGDYQYSVSITGPTTAPPSTGTFTSVSSVNLGFLRKHPQNPYRLIFEKGSIANAIGLNDCWGNVASGALKGNIEAATPVPLDTYMSTYGDGGAGFNVFRWNPANCSFDILGSIAASGNTYLVPEGQRGDELLSTAHAHGFHVMYVFFHLQEWGSALTDPSRAGAVKKAIRYAMARYGAYTDVWELTNESSTGTIPDAWLKTFADYVRSVDPYQRLVTNSWERASDWTILDARSPHLTIYDDALVDEQKYTNDFTTGAPVIAGEMYNTGTSNWDANSAHRMRTYAWTSFMSGFVDVYWNMSFKKGSNNTSGAPNMYIGAVERGYVGALQKISADVDPDAVPVTVSVSTPQTTAHGLRSSKMLLVYAYRGGGSGAVPLTVDVPVAGTATWIDPQTGSTLSQSNVPSGSQILTAPSFAEDIALTVK